MSSISATMAPIEMKFGMKLAMHPTYTEHERRDPFRFEAALTSPRRPGDDFSRLFQTFPTTFPIILYYWPQEE